MEINQLNEALSKYINEDFFSSFLEKVNDDGELTWYDIISQFFSDKSEGVKQYQWQVIPATQYHNALKMYMKDGANFRFPEHILLNWLNLIAKNVYILDMFTEVCGHTRWFPEDEINDALFGDDTEKYLQGYDEFYAYLDSIGFYDWVKLPDGSDAFSDYGRKPIVDILSELSDYPTKEEMIIAINRCLDVTHHRGDLASAFIEGGSKSCFEISNT